MRGGADRSLRGAASRRRTSTTKTFELGAPVPLSGRYAVQGALVRTGLEAWARDAGASLRLEDDRSEPARAARLHAELSRRCRIVLGPYGSDSARAVANTAKLVWNHGAAADDVQRLAGVISVCSPASRYLVALGRAITEAAPGARIAVLAAPGRFAAFARAGIEREAARLGLELVSRAEAADAILLCGPLQWELARLRRLPRTKLLGGVSPGLPTFPSYTEADGLLAPIQWHPDLGGPPGLSDYLAAQAYAAALIAERCLTLDRDDPLSAALTLSTATFFGRFELDHTGVQDGHRLAVIRWRNERQELTLTDAA
jgi:Periplasmic binding protein